MDQSLDSIIKSKQKEKRTTVTVRKPVSEKKTFKSSGGGGKGGDNKGRAPAAAPRRQTVIVQRSYRDTRDYRESNRVNRDTRDNRAPPSREGGSIFDRLGTAGSRGEVSGTKVVIGGLTKAVSTTDITQLCDSIGEVKSVQKKFDSAEVVFAKRSDAICALLRPQGSGGAAAQLGQLATFLLRDARSLTPSNWLKHRLFRLPPTRQP